MSKSFLLLALIFVIGTASLPTAAGQSVISLEDLSAFQTPSKNWQIAGSVSADLEKSNQLSTTKGTGVLVNLMDKVKEPKDLYTKLEHGDMDLELDYMMAKASNSGIYLQGRYEIQLLDSWGDTNPWSGGNAGIYERWDESKPEGQKGYQGYAPRQNVSRAPGLWQHLKISFQAPRFDAEGNKIENAKMIRVELNGVMIHEEVEMLGPTRGPMSEQEVAQGPLRFQGDHGDVAFRNIRITQYDKPRPELTDITYTIYEGKYEAEPAYDSLPPEAEGSSVLLTSDLSPKTNQFLIRYQGTLHVEEPGEYTFDLKVPGGGGLLRINQQDVIALQDDEKVGKITLPAGEMPFELLYSKYVEWIEPALGLNIAGPGVRDYLISDKIGSREEPVDPILVDPQQKPILRSFMDLPDGGPRVTHAVSVGSPKQVHYTYDMDHGALVQFWRGGFLDATPMWHDRGDGSSRPRGSVQHLGTPTMTLAPLTSDSAAWVADTTGTHFRPQGYVLNGDIPAFRYQAYGATVTDSIGVLNNGHGFQRQLTLQNQPDQETLYARLATGSDVTLQEDGLYTVNDKSYYLRVDDAGGAKPEIRNIKGGQELVVPVNQKLTYSILF